VKFQEGEEFVIIWDDPHWIEFGVHGKKIYELVSNEDSFKPLNYFVFQILSWLNFVFGDIFLLLGQS